MVFSGIAHPEELAILTRALEHYCRSNGIAPDSVEHDEAGRLVISLFQRGSRTADELNLALSDMRNRSAAP